MKKQAKSRTSSKTGSKKKGKCEDCGKETDLRGWYFVSPKKKPLSFKNFRKSYRYWCSDHFKIHMFNLWPFTCTDECRSKQSKRTGLKLDKRDTLVWLDMIITLKPDGKPRKIGKLEDVAMKPVNPKCPWCKKGMHLDTEITNAGRA